MRRTHLSADGVTSFEVEFADLRGRDINVVGAGQIVVVRRTKEAVSVGKYFEDAFGEDVSFFFALCLEDLEDQILLAEAAGAGKIERSGDAGKLRNIFFF